METHALVKEGTGPLLEQFPDRSPQGQGKEVHDFMGSLKLDRKKITSLFSVISKINLSFSFFMILGN